MSYHFTFIKKLADIHLLFGYITQSCSGPYNLMSQFPNQQALTIIKTCQVSYFSFPYILASWLVYVTLSAEKNVKIHSFSKQPSEDIAKLPTACLLILSDGQGWAVVANNEIDSVAFLLYSFLLDVYLGVEFPHHVVALFHLQRHFQAISQSAGPFYILTTVYEVSKFSVSTPTLITHL